MEIIPISDLGQGDAIAIIVNVRLAQPAYKGPVFVDLKRLHEIHMEYSKLYVQLWLNVHFGFYHKESDQ